MLFKVKNLGVIAEAEVDLSKDLILLTGQNNTGKTYLAYAIYWFLQSDFNFCLSSAVEDLYHISFERHIMLDPMPITNEKIIELANLLCQSTKIEINVVELVKEIIVPLKKTVLERINEVFLEEHNLQVFFSNQYIKDTSVIINLESENILKNVLEHELNGLIDLPETIFIDKEKKSPYAKFSLNPTIQGSVECAANNIFLYLFLAAFQRQNPYYAYCFTAERSAINIFSKELTLLGNKILRSKDKNLINFATERINRYPQPIKDSLDIAENLKDLTKKISDFAYLAVELEKNILKGNIVVGEFDDLQYKPNGVENSLEIHLTSSLVKSLSPIAFYLRHLAQKNDCIIIDEPELNLHPDNQILVARFLGRLVNEGFKVIVSTHSDYIVKEINNLVMLSTESEARNELLIKYGYSEKETIKPEQIEALLFRLPKNGVMVTPEKIAITPTGLSIKTIDEVIDKLDTMTENIYYKLFENSTN